MPEPATKGLFLSSCCQGKGTSATPPFPDVVKFLLDSSPSPPIFLVSFFWASSKQPKVGEPLVYGVPRKVPGPNICCRRWTVELGFATQLDCRRTFGLKCILDKILFFLSYLIRFPAKTNQLTKIAIIKEKRTLSSIP